MDCVSSVDGHNTPLNVAEFTSTKHFALLDWNDNIPPACST